MRGRAAIVIACLASGCGFEITFGDNQNNGDGGPGDGNGSATGDGGFGCYGVGIVKVCPITQPPPSYTISVPTTLDTNVSGNCTMVTGTNTNGPCVVVAEIIEISAALRGIGPRPIVLVATKTMRIAAPIDVASHRNSTGAGVSTSVCVGGNDPGSLDGGAGGSFGGRGGSGGNGEGGTSGPTITPTSLRGGCRGQNGAGPFGVGGTGSQGGGGLYLIAGMSIDVVANINASGEGGDGAEFGGTNGGGGGGGGSGGMIVLDAPTIMISADIFANGGGGGGGSNGVSNAGNGKEAMDAQTMPDGGTNASSAGKGGRGSLGATLDGGTGENSDFFGPGGGGGGGGAGFIKLYGTVNNQGHISPTATP